MKFMKFRKFYFLFSGLLVLLSIVSLIFIGLKPSIEFTGGVLWELKVPEQVETQEFKDYLSKYYEFSSVYKKGQNIVIRGKSIDNNTKNSILQALNKKYNNIQEVSYTTVGAVLGKELIIKTIIAIILSSFIILGFIWHNFKDKAFGLAAILAVFHDSIILLGAFSFFSIFNAYFDSLSLTALLTTLSFSIHDTVVIFNRIKEIKKRHPKLDIETVANIAVLETFTRSLNNSVTIIIMLLSMTLLGGETLKWFSAGLLVGAIVGTYSSSFLAVPLLVSLKKK